MAIEPLAIGVCSWSLQVKSIPELKRLLGRLGVNVVQIACGDPHHAPWEDDDRMPELARAAAQRGILVANTPEDSEAVDVAEHTLGMILTLRKKLLQCTPHYMQQGGWRPDGGASLKTYFTGALCQQFANIWKKWLRTRVIPVPLPLEAVPSGTASPGPGPDDIVMQRDEIRRGLDGIESERTRAALVLASDGYEQEEIAEILGSLAPGKKKVEPSGR